MKGIGRVTFMALLAEIAAELDAGRPLKAVYENHQGRLGISYRQFGRYAAELIRSDGRDQASSPPLAGTSPPRLAQLEPTVAAGISPTGPARQVARATPRSFNHDPVERPDDRRRLLGEN